MAIVSKHGNDFVTLPLTPPSTIKKEKNHVSKRGKDNDVVPKRLLLQLKKATKKPRLKYLPEPNEVFDIDAYFDLKRCLLEEGDNKQKMFLEHVLLYSKKIVVITGAGISVNAGIPDFRSSKGLFSTLKEKNSNISSGKELFDYNRVYSNNDMSKQFNSMIRKLHHLSSTSKPTNFHYYLNQLSVSGKLLRLYTQNIDGLETQLSHLMTTVPLEFSKRVPPPTTVQLHGSINYMQCNKCCKISEMEPLIFNTDDEKLKSDSITEYVPSCKECAELETVRQVAGLRSKGVGKVRPRIILYNEVHPEGDHIGQITNYDLKKKPDCLIIAGTSLCIPGVKAMCKQFAAKVKESKGYVLYINKELPSKSVLDTIGHVDLIVRGDCQNIPKLMGI